MDFSNKFYKVLLFFFLVVFGAISLYYIPETSIAGIELKKVDVFSDIRVPKIDSSKLVLIPKIKPPFVDTCKTGVICIEDFSPTQSALSGFYEALQKNSKPIRVAYFGDSFIEGDLLTCSLRDLYKEKYGGEGVGFAPINCLTAGFRMTVRTQAKGWEEHSVIDSTYMQSKQGISGHYFFPTPGATAAFSCRTTLGQEPDTCSSASIYFKTDGGLKFTTTINKKDKQQHVFNRSDMVQALTLDGRIEHLRITIDSPGQNSVFYGAALDNKKEGIVIDNFSLRGTSGWHLRGIPQNILQSFDSIRPYDLVVLQYGLNVAGRKASSYPSYKKAMIGVVKYFQENFPQSDILLVSVGDRAMKHSNQMVTMPGVISLASVQQEIASECKIAFWNLLEAMTLDGGVAAYVKSKPSKANLDYTHINLRGGEQIAKHIFQALEYGKERYFERKSYDEEK